MLSILNKNVLVNINILIGFYLDSSFALTSTYPLKFLPILTNNFPQKLNGLLF